MEIQQALNRFAAWLARPSRADGRIILALILSLCLGIICFAESRGASGKAWQVVGVGWIRPSFFDLRAITISWDATRRGVDPLFERFCDDPNRPVLNYPRMWLWPAALGLGERHTIILGWLVGTSFFITVFLLIGRLTVGEALVYALALCSSSTLLAINVANNDLIMFILLSAMVLLFGTIGPFAYSLALVAGFLKLYPIFGLLAAVREKKRTALAIGVVCGIIFFAYIAWTYSDVVQINKSTTRQNGFWAYGSMGLAEKIDDSLKFRGRNSHHVPHLMGFLVAVIILWRAGRRGLQDRIVSTESSRALDCFRVGSLIYIGTFLLGNNRLYRLIFLIMLMPQLLIWIKRDGELRRTGSLMLFCALYLLWETWGYQNIWAAKFLILAAGEVVSWTLFATLCYYLAATSPDWLALRIPKERAPVTNGKQPISP